MTKNNQNLIYIAFSVLAALLLTASAYAGDSFMEADAFKLNLSGSTDNAVTATLQDKGWEKESSVIVLADSLFNESDFEKRSTMGQGLVDITQVGVAGLQMDGDAFLSRDDMNALSNCRLDGASQSFGFMVCTINNDAMIVQ